MSSSIIDKLTTKSMMIFYLENRKISECSNKFGYNREKIRKSFIFHYPYIYAGSNNLRIRKIILKDNLDGWSYVSIKGNNYKIDNMFMRFFQSSFFRDNGTNYLATTDMVNGKRTSTYYHRLIMRVSQGQEVDHINMDRFDNRISNLRICTRKQNSLNRKCKGYRKSHNIKNPFTSRFRGKHLGYFNTIEEAQNNYMEEKKLYSDFFGSIIK